MSEMPSCSDCGNVLWAYYPPHECKGRPVTRAEFTALKADLATVAQILVAMTRNPNGSCYMPLGDRGTLDRIASEGKP